MGLWWAQDDRAHIKRAECENIISQVILYDYELVLGPLVWSKHHKESSRKYVPNNVTKNRLLIPFIRSLYVIKLVFKLSH